MCQLVVIHLRQAVLQDSGFFISKKFIQKDYFPKMLFTNLTNLSFDVSDFEVCSDVQVALFENANSARVSSLLPLRGR
jgi:hypothetical protein